MHFLTITELAHRSPSRTIVVKMPGILYPDNYGDLAAVEIYPVAIGQIFGKYQQVGVPAIQPSTKNSELRVVKSEF